MNSSEAGPLDDQFTALLAMCDEALAAGASPSFAWRADSVTPLRPRLERGMACLQLLRSLLPPTDSADAPSTAPQRASSDGAGELPWTNLGRFQIRHELGRGTYGIVYLAHDPRLDRDVALKIPRADVLADPDLRERFQREARTAAGLDHPNLVPVYEAGEVGPVCYIASAYCPGISLAQWLKQRDEPVPCNDAAWLVATLAEAVHYAHQRGVVHRDLKPGNVLLQIADCRLQIEKPDNRQSAIFNLPSAIPKITDFGLAKLLDSEVSGAGCQTQSGAVLGTPSYMAPEQAEGKKKEIGPAADIYALGAIWYELLTGRPPFQAESPLSTLLLVRSEEPVHPARLRPKLPRDLDTICLRCLEKKPGKRYASAAALAEDLKRFLDGEPIRARPIGPWERGGKWARRRPVVAALLASIAVVSGAGFSGVLWQWGQAEAERRNVTHKAEELKIKNYFRTISLAERELASNNAGRAEELLEECPEYLRGWEWHYLKRLRYGSAPPLPYPGWPQCVTYCPDGRGIVVGYRDGSVKVWDAIAGKELRTMEGHKRAVHYVAASSDGHFLATADLDGVVKLWNFASGELLQTFSTHSNRVTGLSFSPDSRRLASASVDTTVGLWDVTTGQQIHIFRHANEVQGMVFSPDGQRLIASCIDGTVKVWDTTTCQEAFSFRCDMQMVHTAALSQDGQRLALGNWNGAVKVLDMSTGQEILALQGHTCIVYSIAFTRDDQRLVSAGYDGTIKVWDTSSGQEALTLRQGSRINGIVFSPDGRRLVSTCADGAVQVWDATPVSQDEWERQVITLSGHTQLVFRLAFSPDGQRVASASWDGTAKVWDWAAGQELLTFDGHRANVWDVAYSPDGRHLASGSGDGTVKLWDASTGQELYTFTKGIRAGCVAFSPDGRQFVSSYHNGNVKVWDTTTRNEISTLRGHSYPILSLMYSRDGRYLASAGGAEKTVRIWDTGTWKEIHTFWGHTDMVSVAVFSPGGERVATASDDGTARIWDMKTGQPIQTLTGHANRVGGVAFSPDGRYLASASWDQTVRIWDAATGKEVSKLRGHAGYVAKVVFSPDGRHLASCGGYAGKGEIKIWNASLWENGQLAKR
jgi:WD40 repeat protein/serine/threonine protein kinase